MDLITEQRLERQQRMLDAVREAMAETGWAGLTVRDLARRCRVSIPTIYNRFGGKDGLLAAAIEGHFVELLERVTREEGPPGWRRLLALAARCAENMTRQSPYHRALLAAFASARETAPVQAALVRDLCAAFERELDYMRAHAQLDAWVDAHLLAGRLSDVCVSASVSWARGSLSDGGLRAAMPHGVSLLVLGVARGEARKGLERAARKTQSVLVSEAARPRRARPAPLRAAR